MKFTRWPWASPHSSIIYLKGRGEGNGHYLNYELTLIFCFCWINCSLTEVTYFNCIVVLAQFCMICSCSRSKTLGGAYEKPVYAHTYMWNEYPVCNIQCTNFAFTISRYSIKAGTYKKSLPVYKKKSNSKPDFMIRTSICKGIKDFFPLEIHVKICLLIFMALIPLSTMSLCNKWLTF